VKAFKPHVLELPDYPYTHHQAPIKLDQNESPYDIPEALKAEIAEALQKTPLNRYPEMNAERLVEAIADFEGWEASGVVVAGGSNVLLTALALAARKVLDVVPSFSLYKWSARITGTPWEGIPLGEDFELPVAEIERHLSASEEAGVFFFPNPHAPSGRFWSPETVRALAEAAGKGGWLMVVDEAYYHFAPADFKREAREMPHVVISRTFSKAWGLAGVRLGYLLAHPEVAKEVRKLLPPFRVPTPTLITAQVVLENPGYLTETAEKIRRECERVYIELKTHPSWKAYKSHTNFLCIRTPDAEAAFKGLLARGILVRRMDNQPGLEGCIRVTIGTPVENDAFLKAAFELGEGVDAEG